MTGSKKKILVLRKMLANVVLQLQHSGVELVRQYHPHQRAPVLAGLVEAIQLMQLRHLHQLECLQWTQIKEKKKKESFIQPVTLILYVTYIEREKKDEPAGGALLLSTLS